MKRLLLLLWLFSVPAFAINDGEVTYCAKDDTSTGIAQYRSPTITLASLSAVPTSKSRHLKVVSAISPTSISDAGPILGTTPEEISARFPAIIEQNFKGNTAKILHALHDDELANLAALYTLEGGVGRTQLLKTFSENLQADDLARAAAAFGQDRMQTAVNRWAPADVALAFTSHTVAAPLQITPQLGSDIATRLTLQRQMSGTWRSPYMLKTASPNPGMTIYEIYLEYRTAPVGAMGVSAALVETGMYSGMYLGVAWGVGTGIGTFLNNMINTYFPAVGNAIGATVASIVDGIAGAVGAVGNAIGELGNTLNNIFGEGAPKQDEPNVPLEDNGDWAIMAPVSDYQVSEGC